MINDPRIFYEKKTCFGCYEYPFGSVFLANIFKEGYKKKYSLVGDGIYDLILIENKIYDVKFKQVNNMLPNDGKKAFRDETKDKIINAIAKGLDDLNLEYTINNGKFITFKLFNYIAKVEVIKKAAMPA